AGPDRGVAVEADRARGRTGDVGAVEPRRRDDLRHLAPVERQRHEARDRRDLVGLEVEAQFLDRADAGGVELVVERVRFHDCGLARAHRVTERAGGGRGCLGDGQGTGPGARAATVVVWLTARASPWSSTPSGLNSW